MSSPAPAPALVRGDTARSDGLERKSTSKRFAPQRTNSRIGASMKDLMQEFDDVNDAKDPEELRKTLRLRRGHRISIRETFWHIMRAAAPFFRDPSSRCCVWMIFLSIVVLLYIETKLDVWQTGIGGDINESLQGKDQEGFQKHLVTAVVWTAITVPVHVCRRYLSGCFMFEWRRFITLRMLDDYIGNAQTYYRMKFQSACIDNPDQRLGEDVGRFTSNSVRAIEAMMLAVFTIINSAGALYVICPVLLYFVILFCICLTLIQLGLFGSRLMCWQRVLLAQEADLRFGLVRVREHAESIAFYQGEAVEKTNNVGFFRDVMYSSYQKLNISVIYHGTNRVANGVSALVPYFIVAPQYFAGDIGFGDVYQAVVLFLQLFDAMETVVAQLENMAELGANAIRVHQFQETLDSLKKQAQSSDCGSGQDCAGLCANVDGDISTDGDHNDLESGGDGVTSLETHGDRRQSNHISLHELGESSPSYSRDTATELYLRLQSVTLNTPLGVQNIVSDLSFELCAGESLLICGESGCGKSSLLRAIGGLWASGHGRIVRRGSKTSIFLPQYPYLCMGSLRENVTYPVGDVANDVDHTEETDKEVLRAIEIAQIDYLVNRHGLDAEIDYDTILSGGEKQSLCFSRIFFKEKVDFALLDEATCAMDEEREAHFYEEMRRHVPCYVSVGHRRTLEKYHTHKLHLEKLPGGGCSALFTTIDAHRSDGSDLA